MIVRRLLGLWFAFAVASSCLQAQGEARPAELDPAAVAASLASAKEAADLSDADRAAAVESYTKAIADIRAGDAAAEQAAAYAAAKETLASRLAAARAALDGAEPAVRAEPAQGATLADLEKASASADEAQKVAAKALANAEERIQNRVQRQPMLPQLIAAARERMTGAVAQFDAFRVGDAPTVPTLARRRELQAAVWSATQAVRVLEAELQSYEGSDELLTAERDLAQRRASRAEQLARSWQELVQAEREAAARRSAQAAADAVAAAEDQHPLLIELARENERLAQLRGELASRLAEETATLDSANRRRGALEQDLQDLSKRVESVQFSDTLGALLRDRRLSLPDVRTVRKRLKDTRVRRDQLQLDRFELDDERRRLREPDHLGGVVAAAIPAIAPADLDTVRKAEALLRARLEIVDQLRNDSGALFNVLIRVEEAELALLAKLGAFVEFVNEHVLWAPSSPPIWRTTFEAERAGLQWLGASSNWGSVLQALGRDLREHTIELLLVVAVVVVLVMQRRRARRQIAAHGEAAQRGASVAFGPTLAALWWTFVMAVAVPTALWGVGWRLQENSNPTEFARAFGHALQAGAWLQLALGFLAQSVRVKGLTESHFAWSSKATLGVRRSLRWMSPVSVVGAILLTLLENSGSVFWKEGLGRLVLVVVLAVLVAFFWRVLHPRSGVASVTRRGAPLAGWASRLRALWFALGVGLPALLLLLSLFGYHFTAVQLVLRFAATVGVVTALLFVNEVIVRGLVLARRRMAQQQAAERRRAAAQKAEEQGTAVEASVVDEPSVDVSSIAEQTRSLLRSLLTLAVVLGVWVIWVDVLPALRVFRDVSLGGETTLADALSSSIVFVMTFLAARNVPGVLQITILQRLQVHDGERHAIATIARYLIVLIGLIVGFSTLGIDWGKIQWLAAGVSVGLGFGLQEVFANFVSGLIILFERPIRVGDLVTVAGIDGYVTRIQMRATTIRDYNRKELVIPNKEFITGSVVNWTLSDAVTRLIIKVGIAYGSDTRLARRLLLEVAESEPNVLDKPKPKALFMGFGESSLDFQLRVFTANVDVWPEVIDSVHRRVDDAFRAHDIEISFPQRDLHIRSAKPLVEWMERRAGIEADGSSEDAQPS